MKIIFIAGDGRSGSTLLETILSNAPETVSVGECSRYWTRYVENSSVCGCGSKFKECALWSVVHRDLEVAFPGFNAVDFSEEVREFQRYKNFKRMPELLKEERWDRFARIVASFYKAIATHSEENTIIDSSKSIPWARLLQTFSQFDVRVIHLERELPGVANSWKKKLRLPEYHNSEVLMPTKSNALIVKSWLKVKIMARSLPKNGLYLFVRYEQLCKQTAITLQRISAFTEIQLDSDHLKIQDNHAIGGNPMRYDTHKEIVVTPVSGQTNHLSFLERIVFSLVHKLASFVGP